MNAQILKARILITSIKPHCQMHTRIIDCPQQAHRSIVSRQEVDALVTCDSKRVGKNRASSI